VEPDLWVSNEELVVGRYGEGVDVRTLSPEYIESRSPWATVPTTSTR
jgi:hypothetical protein